MSLPTSIIRCLIDSEDDNDDSLVKELSRADTLPAPPVPMLGQAIEGMQRYLRRRCRGTSVHQNPKNENFVFGKFGKPPDSVVVTLLYFNPETGWELTNHVKAIMRSQHEEDLERQQESLDDNGDESLVKELSDTEPPAPPKKLLAAAVRGLENFLHCRCLNTVISGDHLLNHWRVTGDFGGALKNLALLYFTPEKYWHLSSIALRHIGSPQHEDLNDDESLVKELSNDPKVPPPPEVMLGIAVRAMERYLDRKCQETSFRTFEFVNPDRCASYAFGKFGKSRHTLTTLLDFNPVTGWELTSDIKTLIQDQREEDSERRRQRQRQESLDDSDEYKDLYPEPEPEPEKAILPLGSISSGTMREEDLIPAFLYALESLDPELAEKLRNDYAESVENAGPDDGYFCWEVLFDTLNNFTPPYTFFGSHPGDGSDYGVWINDEAIQDDLRYEPDTLQSMREGETMPTGSKYVVVLNQYDDAFRLLDGATGATIWEE